MKESNLSKFNQTTHHPTPAPLSLMLRGLYKRQTTPHSRLDHRSYVDMTYTHTAHTSSSFRHVAFWGKLKRALVNGSAAQSAIACCCGGQETLREANHSLLCRRRQTWGEMVHAYEYVLDVEGGV